MRPSTLAAASLVLVAACVGDVDPYVTEDEAPPEDGVTEIAAGGDTIPGCNGATSVVLYSESTNAFTLPSAFAAAADPCTNYYVYLPALEDKTQVRPSADKVHQLGPNFHAMAEFHWAAWHDWVAASPGTRDWKLAGQAFRARMVAAGFDLAAGDTWAINEFPASTRTGADSVWDHERAAVKGLAQGDGSREVKGAVFLAGMGQNLENFAVYKPNVKTWLQQDAWWTDMNSAVKFFAYEVYADPHYDCGIGSNVPTDRADLNAYLEHLPRLAKEGGAATATAASFLKRRYVPLLQVAWNSNKGFGNNMIGLSDFEKFTRLQIYATHFWSAQYGSPGRQIGFAWTPSNATPAQELELSRVVSSSVGRAYPSNGFFNLGKLACSASGSLDGCGCTVSGSPNPGWDAFGSW